ncbi:hypothetical protein [Catalinimonas niigatensis]|uniref:hypothetical protein n=1 Tax=Catalinimonas niigatensis TaxID=1397264 RepID=UPI002665489E|nr:hypothetical protein [Catalinimonas niigatensis]WPP49731.1 hypothetical protein PZB72_23960 [Catalinimonas niigatensis]
MALEKLTGQEHRTYAAALTVAHSNSSARKAKRVLSVSQQIVELGLQEQETGRNDLLPKWDGWIKPSCWMGRLFLQCPLNFTLSWIKRARHQVRYSRV